jgi:hypothetical protein
MGVYGGWLHVPYGRAVHARACIQQARAGFTLRRFGDGELLAWWRSMYEDGVSLCAFTVQEVDETTPGVAV